MILSDVRIWLTVVPQEFRGHLTYFFSFLLSTFTNFSRFCRRERKFFYHEALNIYYFLLSIYYCLCFRRNDKHPVSSIQKRKRLFLCVLCASVAILIYDLLFSIVYLPREMAALPPKGQAISWGELFIIGFWLFFVVLRVHSW
jgi:hypothetical protein